jgi:hypothetical protein
VVPAEPDGQVRQIPHPERPLASQGGGDIAVAYTRRALAHTPRLGHQACPQQPDITVHGGASSIAAKDKLTLAPSTQRQPKDCRPG